MSIKERIDEYFKVSERGSSLGTEIRAGTITFLTMAYILPINAAILGDTGGTCDIKVASLDPDCHEELRIDLIYATALSAGIACLCMGFSANLPFALAPGMGINAYFAYDVVGFAGSGKVNFQTALFATFLEGIIFVILSVTGIRSKIFALIPEHIKLAMTAGIGMFLAHIGLQSSEGIGLITADGAVLVNLGGCALDLQVCNEFGLYCECPLDDTMEGATTWIGILGVLFLALMLIYRIKGAIFWCVIFVTFLSWFRGDNEVTYFGDSDEGETRWDYFKNVVEVHSFKMTPFVLFEDLDMSNSAVWIALITLLYNDSCDTAGTLFSMAEYLKILDDEGNFPGDKAAFASDAVGTIVGALLGTSTVTTYIESGSGINEGGRTGLTAIVVGLFFFSSVLFSPIWASIPPWATGPALIAVGSLMVKSVLKINWNEMRIAFPSFITMILMPLTYSISTGIIGGLMVHVWLLVWDYLIQNYFPDIKCPLRDYRQDDDDMDDSNNNNNKVGGGAGVEMTAGEAGSKTTALAANTNLQPQHVQQESANITVDADGDGDSPDGKTGDSYQ